MSRPKLEIVEVSPRDGLQNEPELVSTQTKLALIDLALRAGFQRIEAGSFVNPRKVPQMADSPDVFAAVGDRRRGVYTALALNRKGAMRAIAAGAREINYVFCASEEFSVRNNGGAIAQTLAAWPDVAVDARAAGVRLSAVIATAFGCPFEGEVPVARIAEIAAKIADEAPFELTLADTIGVGAPSDVRERFAAVAASIPPGIALRAHFHNTRNTGVANAVAAAESGVRVLDASLAGIGGCPFAPGAAGNVASEDLVYVFERMGFDTGIDLETAIEAARFIASALGKQPGMVSRCSGFGSQLASRARG